MSLVYIFPWLWSGVSIITTSAHFGGIGDSDDLEARGPRLLDRLARGRQPHLHAHAAVLQVQRVRVALRSVPDDGDFLPANDRDVCRIFVIHLCCHENLLSIADLKARTTTVPV